MHLDPLGGLQRLDPHLVAVDLYRLVITTHPDLDLWFGADLPRHRPLPAQCVIDLTVST